MALNFNTTPYFDDFDPSKNYHRILFKPGYAVQARELTQSQTILQNQVSSFASAIFSQNTPIAGGKVTTNLNCYYLKLNSQYNSATITAAPFLNKVITDSTGTILAKVIATAESTGTAGVGDPPTLIISYISGIQFSDATSIFDATGATNLAATTVGVAGGSTCTGPSSVASISDGTFYIVDGQYTSQTENSDGTYSTYSIGNFVTVTPQTVILDKYDNTPTFRIGLEITESIIDSVDDSSLLDPAVGASNYQAPGADRYQISLTLATLPLTLGNDDQFIELVRVVSGSIVKQVDGTVYSTIDDYFAKRDYESNGDYVVYDFSITPVANTSSNTQYDLNIGKGVAYVRGYRIENQSTLKLTNNRARTTAAINTNQVFVDYGNYFIVDTINGTFDVTTMPSVDLHCVTASQINTTNNTTYNSTLVGTSFMRNLVYISDPTDTNTASYIYKAYVSDITTNSLVGNVASATATTITINDPLDQFSTTANAYFGVTVKITGGTDIGDTRSIVSYNSSTKTFTVDNPFTIIPDSTTKFTLLFTTADVEALVHQTSLTISAKSNINYTGKLNGTVTGDTIFYNSSDPELLFQIGNPYVANTSSSSYTATRVFRNYSFGGGNTITLSISTLPFRFFGNGSLNGQVVKQLFTVVDQATGNILDFSESPSSNVVSISGSGTVATFTSSTYSGKTVNIIAQVSVYNGDNTSYVEKYKNLVVGNTTAATAQTSATIINSNTYVDLTNGQVYVLNALAASNTTLSLYVTDVKQIKQIIDTGSAGTVVTSAMLSGSSYDITNRYTFNNGQKDNYYDFASVSLIPGAPLPSGNILIIFDYYSHTGGDGYFAVGSYLNSASPEQYQNIPTYTAKNGDVYKLSDSLDFRPSRKNGQTAYVFEATTSSADAGILIPVDITSFTSNYGYYLARDDKLVLTKDKLFQIIPGTPSTSPQFPAEPSGSLILATLAHDPYTAYVPGEAPAGTIANLSINKVQHKRWAKSDITDLQTRVNNLEYYTSLSLLEQSAQSLQIPDSNGLNRFKNGILVDDFSSYLTADTSNPDFASNINIRTQQLMPLAVINNFQLQNPSVLASLGTAANNTSVGYMVSSLAGTSTNIYTLPYTVANVAVQPLASSTISLNPFSVPVQQGYAYLNPPMDNWVDVAQAPAVLVTDPTIQVSQQNFGVNLTNAGDFASIPGTAFTTTSVKSTASGSSTPATTYSTGSTTGSASSSNPNSLFDINVGYLKNSAVLGYIRPQQIIVAAAGLLVNTPLRAFFDGVDVSDYMTQPNTIELTNVSGTFNTGDVVGYSVSGTFNPIARVAYVYYYPNVNKTQCRLYVGDIIGVAANVQALSIQNAQYNTSGAVIGSTASGTVKGAYSNTYTQVAFSSSGIITGVGGSFSYSANVSIPAQKFYTQPIVSTYCSLLNQYGVWGTPNPTQTFNATCACNFPVTGTYTFKFAVDNAVQIFIDGVNIATLSGVATTNFSTQHTATASVTAGVHNISWTATNGAISGSYTNNPAAFGMTVTAPSGAIIFTTKNPPTVTYTNVGNEVAMPGGGSFMEGVTQITLDPNSANNASYYVGSTISITSTYVQ